MLGPADVSWIRAVRQAIGRYGTLYVAEPSDERATRLPGELRALNIGGVQVLQADTTRVDLPDASLDLVLCIGVLGGRPRRERLFWELHRLLRPGAHLVVADGVSAAGYLSAGRVRREALGVGLQAIRRQGMGLTYTLMFRKTA